MAFQFKRAIREGVSLIIGLCGSSGSGKTYSAMRLASGMSDGKPFAVIDTEAGRAKHYADQFNFDHGDLDAPFTPERYTEAILAAADKGYSVIVIDSISHEHEGDGGLLDWHQEEITRMCKGNDDRRDAMSQAAWIKPKMAHKRMVQKILRLRTHLIVCLRAEEKTDIIKDPKTGKMMFVPAKRVTGIDGWVPICERRLPYELTASLLLLPSNPGIPNPIKLQEQHKPLFPKGELINEEAGKKIVLWAKGINQLNSKSRLVIDTFSSIGWDELKLNNFLGKPAYDWGDAEIEKARKEFTRLKSQFMKKDAMSI